LPRASISHLIDYRSAEDFAISIWATVQMLSKQQMQTGQELEEMPHAN
jgi:hypothetical protein